MSSKGLEIYRWLVFFATLGFFVWLIIYASHMDAGNYPISITNKTTSESIKQSSSTGYSTSSNVGNTLVDSSCEDSKNVQDYKLCMDNQALEDWHQDRVADAGAP